MKKCQQLFFDESGFTGPNLLDDRQSHFVYAGLAVNSEEADTVVARLAKDHRLGKGELKYTNLIASENGRRAISETVNIYSERTKIAVFHKTFALAGKFFEYVFEPVLAPNSLPFYESNFHRFIQQYIYMEMLAVPNSKEWILDFQDWVRRGDHGRLEQLVKRLGKGEGLIAMIRDFVAGYRQEIMGEIEGLRRDTGEMNPWILDLTTTALFNLLTDFGAEYRQIDVVCDEAAPLKTNAPFFNVMIDRTDRPTIALGGATRPVTFNLKQEIRLMSSKTVAGLQLADLCAGAVANVLNGPTHSHRDATHSHRDEWIEKLGPGIVIAVLPSWDEVNEPASHRAFAHKLALHALADCARKGIRPIPNLGHVIAFAKLAAYRRQLGGF
jgi:hypothetical protein